MVNQASMTGESVPVHKSEGAYVYAGTVVEDGECTIAVENTAGGGRYDRIVKMIEESEKMKSAAEDKASHLADKLVQMKLSPQRQIIRELSGFTASAATSTFMISSRDVLPKMRTR